MKNKAKISHLEKKLKELKDNFNNSPWSRDDFSQLEIDFEILGIELEVDQERMRKVLTYFSPYMISAEKEAIFNTDPRNNSYYKKTHTKHEGAFSSFFLLCDALISRVKDREQLVPQYLLSVLDNAKNQDIISFLVRINLEYEAGSGNGLLEASNSLLNACLDRVTEISGKKLGGKRGKIAILLEDNGLRERYGLDKELILALNNDRITRNVISVHTTKGSSSKISLAIAASYAYLSVLVLQILISRGLFD